MGQFHDRKKTLLKREFCARKKTHLYANTLILSPEAQTITDSALKFSEHVQYIAKKQEKKNTILH